MFNLQRGQHSLDRQDGDNITERSSSVKIPVLSEMHSLKADKTEWGKVDE
jgi:hypothetical protein